ncbi:MAG: biopolymer transporter ExbD [Pseudomonadota bacterium]
MRRLRHRQQEEAELNITAFMNLMIVLVPVLLMTMVFSHITVLGLTLPDAASSPDTPEEDQHLELVVRDTELQVYYPRGYLLKRIEQIEVVPEEGEELIPIVNPETGEPELPMQHDYDLLADVLQEVKRLLKEKEIDKRDITILSQEDTDYQTIVSLMDASRSFKAVVAGSVVNAELFPEVSLGDAPVLAEQVAGRP